ncbi:RHS repeat-associated protein [Rheinheimera pacifica]|uniref:RHS repeat domain-containing protein n=1 Tax=Rheinheimera pacifica TaxID=173990 RepID=UPI002167381C|nr:RHS repeat-associated core domain-containing protein [Rheinheimera pacifica]MCS4306761.1 RHS repeat-associated protein [Rheinheimera pacifica]
MAFLSLYFIIVLNYIYCCFRCFLTFNSLIVLFIILNFSSTALANQGLSLLEHSKARLINVDGLKIESFEGFGDEVDIATGDVSFSAIDISIPGNSELKVEFRRKMPTISTYLSAVSPNHDLGEWRIDLPYVTTRVIYDEKDKRFRGKWGSGNECRGRLQPGYDRRPDDYIELWDYWHGVYLNVPGETAEHILDNTGHLVARNYAEKITKGGWLVRCEDNVTGGESYVVTSPSGITYTFSQKKFEFYRTVSRALEDGGGWPDTAKVFNAYLLVSRVEDRFGNYVIYNYEGDKLGSIASNDGRIITIKYNENGKVKTVSSSEQSFGYEYDYKFDIHGKVSSSYLTKVVLPDQTYWSYDLKAIANAYLVPLPYHMRYSCTNFTDESDSKLISGNIKSPTGAESTLNFRPRRFMLEGSMHDGISYGEDLCQVQYSLTDRVVKYAGGQESSRWRYEYTQNKSMDANGSRLPPNITNRDHKWTTVHDMDGAKQIYYFNRVITSPKEGKLEALERYSKEGRLLDRVINSYKIGEVVGDADLTDYYSYHVVEVTANTNLIHKLSYIDHVSIEVFGASGDATKYNSYYSDFNIYGVPAKANFYKNSDEVKYFRLSYYHDTKNWVLNLPTKTEVSDDGSKWSTVDSQTYYTSDHTAKSLPYQQYRFGQLQDTKTYYSDGSLYQQRFNVANRWVEFRDYKRGKPQLIKMPNRYTASCTNSASCYISASQAINDDGTVAQATDFNGNRTDYQYDTMRRLTDIIPADTRWSPTTISYATSDGYFTQTITRGNFRKKIQYDGLLRPVLSEEWDSSNASATRRYTAQRFNAYNQPEFISYPSTSSAESQGTAFEYDGLQRLIRQYSTVDNKGMDYAYLAGNQIRTTDARGNSTITTYRAFGSPSQDLPTKIEQPHGVTTDINYNLFDNIITISQGSITESRRYNAQQQLCRLVRPDIGHTAYSYNALGQPVWIAQGASGGATACNEASVTAAQKVSYGYDNLGSLRIINYPDNTPDKTYTYDNQGNITALAAGTAIWDYTYNSANLMETEVLTLNNISWITDPTYNAMGHVSSITYPSGKNVSYAPNALGQPTRVGSYATAASYYANGQLKGFTYGNGLSFSQLLDTQQRPEYQTVKRSSSNVLDYRYQYDNNHNINTISDLITPAKNISLTYDDLDRLDTAEGFWGSGSFDYDSIGNITKKTLGSQSLTYAYNINNRLTGISGSVSRTFAYDSRGNVTNNGQRAFSFNLANQLITSGTNSYQYDGYNRRVKKVSNGKTQYSLYNAAGQLLMTDGDNGPTEYFHLGTKLIAKESQVLTSEDTPGYTGHLEDDDLQLTYMQQRYYDPVIGRFYSNDPVDFMGHMQRGNPTMGFNRYAYANNNPYKYTDPDGQFINFAVGFIVGAGIEAAVQYATTGSIDTKSVLIAGAVGSLTGGVGASLANNAAKGAISSARAISTTAATGGTANAAGTVVSNAIDGEVTSFSEVGVAAAAGAIGAGVGAKLSNSVASTLEKGFGGLNSSITNTTRSSMVGNTQAAATTSGFTEAGKLTVDVVTNVAQKEIDKQ